MFIPVFHSKSTDQWEVAGLLFLSTETKENVEIGVQYFKESLPYSIEGTRLLFFTDKDWDYINVSYLVHYKIEIPFP